VTLTSTAMPTLDPADVYPIVGEMTARDAWSRDRLLEQQRRRLDAALRHAVEASAYYKGVLGRSVDAGATLEELPILTKSTLMEQWDRIVTDPRLRLRDAEAHLAGDRPGALLLGEYRVCATSGTTGERAVVVYDRAGWCQIVANILRFVAMIGASPDSRLVGVGAPTPLHLTNRANAELRAGRSDAPRLSVITPLPEVVAALNAYQPEFVGTYPSFIRRLVDEQEAGRLRIRPNKLASTAEVLAPEVRDLARRTWGADVLDSYGCTEGGLLGTECPAVAGIHVAEDILVFEPVDEHGRGVPPGMPSAGVLLTTLFNGVLPLIRYEVSDVVTMADGPCPCGRPFARVASIVGRREEYLSLRAGGGGDVRVHVSRLRAPLAGVPGLRQFQIVPAFDRLRLVVSARDGARPEEMATAAAATVRTALRDVGADVDVTTEVVSEIDRVGTGAKEQLVGAAASDQSLTPAAKGG
jgi:phenylacetate-coenzyme A ligase PaaK-like adenylate-forming protein